MSEEQIPPHRTSPEKFASEVLTMIRPSDQELSGGSGALGCRGGDIWATISACASGDDAALRALLTREPNLARAEYWYTGPLHYAVREGHLKCVQLLLDTGADPSAIRYGGAELPIVARDRGHEAVALLIERAQQQALGAKPVDAEIHRAVKAGEMETIRTILDTDSSAISSRDAKGLTPLHLAVAGGHTDIVALLLEQGADTEAITPAGGTYAASEFTALDMAIWESDFWIGVRGNWAMVDFLLEHGAAYTLVIAAARGDAARVDEILAGDPGRVNTAQANGRKALSAAVQFGHLDLAKRLLDAGADPNLPEGRYVPRGAALYFAARDKHYDLVSLLLERGASPESGIDSCGNVWHVADSDIRLQLYSRGLTDYDADLGNIDALAVWADKDPEGLARSGCGTVFAMIVKNEWDGFPNPMSDERKEALLRMLLARGVRVPPVVTGCRTYLWHKPKFTRILLEHGMDPNLPNWQRVTPLHDVCGLGGRGEPDENRLELAALFLEFGADINARDEEYRSTPLGWAARSGLIDMVEFLLERGAEAQLPDDEPWATPLAWAQKRGHANIAAVLKARGAQA